jgi:hypothetical protein
MKEALVGDKGIPNDKIIDIVWSLIVMERSTSSISNPLIPKALDALSNFNRETPLTQTELIKLYQIHLYL